ncbi:MAG: Dabb family protein [Desulfuromonadaceae bacterium]|nr:Dabb family protein [Desulfuromonadaceae bacterium]
MLKHLVFFKFNDTVSESDICGLQQSLSALPGVIEEIRAFEVGRDIVRSERSYDLALVSAFADRDALHRYQLHPAHQAVIVKVKQLCSSVVAVDYAC